MKVYVERDDTHHEIPAPQTVQELLEALEINVHTVLVLKNNELVTEDETLTETDDIKIITVVSGG